MESNLTTSIFLEALNCRNEGRPPVWMMRQAGRYLPEYRALREKHSLWEMFHDPDLATAVTLLPFQRLKFDAAILFSDILVIAEAFGCTVHFPMTGGPRVELAGELKVRDLEERLHYVPKTIKLLKKELHVPLIGFCGGPFTVATYMAKERKELLQNQEFLHALTEASIEYLKLQVQAGVDAVQIFDSWANLLEPSQFALYVQNHLKKMVDAVQAMGVPVIVFCRDSSLHPKQLAAIEPTAISFDWQKPIEELRRSVPATIAVQGNIDPEILKTTPKRVIEETRRMLDAMQGEPGYIVNLGHGVLPDTPVANVEAFVHTVLSS